MKRVTGLGGIFFKSDNPKETTAWYAKHLGVGDSFRWKDPARPDAKVDAHTVWAPFKGDTTYFAPSEKPFMINYRVEDLEKLMKALKDEGVTIVGDIEVFPYGKFGWIMDPDGNKIELWEPIDEGFGD